MTRQSEEALRSGAAHVDQTEQMAHGYSEPHDASVVEFTPEDANDGSPLGIPLTHLTLTMFEKGSSVHVRVGNPHNAVELYEHAFASADEANTALLEAGILTSAQVPNPTQLAGTGIALEGVTPEQLEAAGLKRHGASTL